MLQVKSNPYHTNPQEAGQSGKLFVTQILKKFTVDATYR